jgi:RNA polymerase sigma-70 factor (ECF subfamily)
VNQSLTMAGSRNRRTRLAERVADEAVPDQVMIDESLVDRERAALIHGALAGLNHRERAVVYLRYFLQLSEGELAEYLGCAPGTVKSRLHRALARLKDVIQRDYPELIGEMS